MHQDILYFFDLELMLYLVPDRKNFFDYLQRRIDNSFLFILEEQMSMFTLPSEKTILWNQTTEPATAVLKGDDPFNDRKD